MGALLFEDRVVVDDEPSINRLQQKGFGRISEGKLELSLLEALYLVENGSLKVKINGKNVVASDLTSRALEEDFPLRYRVYRDLRERGYIIKTGFKFGAHFRVYERGEFPKEHSKYLVHCTKESDIISFPELSRSVRLAEGVKKAFVFAVVDEEGDVTYYSINRMTP